MQSLFVKEIKNRGFLVVLNELYSEAECRRIDVFYFPMQVVTAISAPLNSGYVIGIDVDKLQTIAHETVCLAHELGHCVTDSFYNINSDFDLVSRHEARADAWAFRRLMPRSELQKLLEVGFREVWEIAEYFDVTDEFVHKALVYYDLF